jgi:site-specific recombinase XerC
VKGGAPQPCTACKVNRVAWTSPRVDCCYRCLPGGPFAPPPCRRCGEAGDYYSAGLCSGCHQYAPQQPGPCRDCYAWGVIRKHKWLCWGCRYWRAEFPRGTCTVCAREVPVNPDGACHLCWRQWAMARRDDSRVSLADANRAGQQLYFANTLTRNKVAAPARSTHRTRPPRAGLVGHRQLVLFDMTRDLRAGREHGFPPPPDEAFAAGCQQLLTMHANRHGWSRSSLKKGRQALNILLALQDTPGGPVRASHTALLASIGLPGRHLLEFLTEHGLADDDRPPLIETWFATRVRDLPEPMLSEVRAWFEVMLRGSTAPPRSKPRSPVTIRTRVRWALPVLRAWAASGVTSLCEISRSDVLAALPPSGTPRATVGAALRSLFSTLKRRRMIFMNPVAGIRTGSPERRQPMPADLAAIRDALNSQDPATAAVAALFAFCGLASGQLRSLQLTDIRDGRLLIGNRSIPLARPARERVTAWLDERARRWPATANPHLFIHSRTALGTGPVGQRWVKLKTGLTARVMREDRILDEVHATSGDVRRLMDLFGLTAKGAQRYTATLNHPSLDSHPGRESTAADPG